MESERYKQCHKGFLNDRFYIVLTIRSGLQDISLTESAD